MPTLELKRVFTSVPVDAKVLIFKLIGFKTNEEYDKRYEQLTEQVKSGVVMIAEDMQYIGCIDPKEEDEKHGHWICTMFDDSTEEHGKAIRDYCKHGGDAMQWQYDYAYCSKCLKGYCVTDNCMFEEDPNYCPNCGAKMDEKVDE